MALDAEGAESTLVQDAKKITCPYCGGTTHQVSILGDEPEDVVDDSYWTSLGLENAQTRTATIALCQCGHEFCTDIILTDVAAADGSTTPALTDLDATVANGLAGWWWCVLVGTDIKKYVRIASNTVATPTVCTLDYLTHTDGDGITMIKRVEPIGWTRIVA